MRNIILHIHIFLTVALIALVSVGCHDRHAAELLARADAVMETAPDSARVLLDSIEPSGLGAADVALYAVLDAQSRHKLDLAAPSDSLLNIAVDRYTSYGPDSLLMKALFYRAIPRMEEGLWDSAVVDMMESRGIADTLKDKYWKAKNAEAIADMMRQSLNFQEEIVWRNIAFEEYHEDGKIYNELFALCDLASAMLNGHDSVGCIRTLELLDRRVTEVPDSESLKVYNLPTKLFYHINYGSDEDLGKLFRDSVVNVVCATQPGLYLAKADLLTRKGEYVRSRNLLDSLCVLECMSEDRALLYHSYYSLAKATTDWTLLCTATDSLLKSQLRDVEVANAHSVIIAQRDYFNNKAKSNSERFRRSRQRTVWIVMCLGLLLLIAVIVYQLVLWRKNKLMEEQVVRVLEISNQLEIKKQLEGSIKVALDSLRKENAVLQEELKESKDISRIKEAQIETIQATLSRTRSDLEIMSLNLEKTFNHMPAIYRERWKTLEMLCKQLYNRDGVPDKLILNDIKRCVDKIRSEEFFRTLVMELDRDMDGIVTRFYNVCPRMKERDRKLCVLSFAKVGNATIGMLLNMTADHVSVQRKRLRDRIGKMDIPDKDLFIAMLTNTDRDNRE